MPTAQQVPSLVFKILKSKVVKIVFLKPSDSKASTVLIFLGRKILRDHVKLFIFFIILHVDICRFLLRKCV